MGGIVDTITWISYNGPVVSALWIQFYTQIHFLTRLKVNLSLV